ncbi:phosphoribosyltransferase [Nocardia aurantia]|uniref:phosphoribosyltransferase n=1 Tax=Nocardia aurantia TaxID=2585199 RepID=UPI0029E7CDBC|nr:phosphoribosyltransferase family protein [Nocardia aurantia]
MDPYPDRAAAGRVLGELLRPLHSADPLVLGLPRGGVPVAAAVRAEIGGDLDILLVRKLGVPWQPELAMGAIGEDGVRVLNEDVLRHVGATGQQLAAVEQAEIAELDRRTRMLRAGRAPIPIAARIVVIVDDGMATGATMAAACEVVRMHRPRRLVVAVPVSSHEALQRVGSIADEAVCPLVPEMLGGVGAVYGDFHQLADDEVLELLHLPSP